MQLSDVAETSGEVAATPARLGKVAALAELLRRVDSGQARIVVAWLSGELTQRQIGVGWAALRTVPPPADTPTLAVEAVEDRFTEIGQTSGAGSQKRRRALLDDLFATATPSEQDFLRRLLGGELRQGAQVGVMTDAIARAAEAPLATVRRAAMLSGDLPAVAAAALGEGAAALDRFHLSVGTPVGPMLAQTATGIGAALERVGGAAGVEWKLDGARLQVHRDGDEVRLFTRSLDDVTARLPEIVDAVRAMACRTLIADGEAIAVRADGRPEPFQVTASRFGSRTPTASALRLFLFDVIHLDGVDLLDRAWSERVAALDRVTPAPMRIGRVVTDDAAVAADFVADTLAAGHEGVVVKAPDSPYDAGRRGAAWQKVKPVHTLDLVVLAVERGSGRRSAWLSNIHLGARDPDGEFVMLGKTFKGMTDEMLRWQTQRFTEIAEGPVDGWVVRVRPVQVVEIAFDGVQRSSRYPGGVALRFARVLRYRDDKSPEEADTIHTVRAFASD